MAYAVRDQGILLSGFTELAAALRSIEGGRGNFGLDYELKRRLRLIGEKVAEDAPAFVTHKTGRHGSGTPLEESVKVSVTGTAASVYSTSVYGGVQNVGAWSKDRGPHVSRANASGWMNKSVSTNKAWVEQEMEGVVDWVIREFEAGLSAGRF